MSSNGRNGNGQFAKGHSGNPNGRPKKGRALSDLLRTAGNKSHGEGITRKRALAEKIWEMALDGDLSAARLIYEYVDGKPKQRHEHAGNDGGAIQHTITEVVVEMPPDESLAD